MEYAQLKPGRRFAPLHSLLYYSQRMVTYPSLRRLVVRALSGAVRLRQGAGSELYASTDAEEAALDDLYRSGYAPLGNLLDDQQCDEIHAWLADKLLIDRDRVRPGFTLAQRTEAVRVADYQLRDVIACPHILALANSPPLLGLAARYMACKPTISALGLRWSFPVPGSDSALQAFHRDSEDWRYLKVLVYLTDVDDGAGPHVYLHGSHLTQAPVRLRFYSDSEISRAHSADMLLTAIGTRGFCFAVDTAGIHKGTAPALQPRLMLQIQYSLLPSYAYRYAPEHYQGALLLDPYVNRLIVRPDAWRD
ncbi:MULTISPECIES: phytanoyl-CoA dioxygenase family protein [unclassified Duganella]|uniref:phytanoyl-CoA dioxygenase family protein n=1 Tax=unclassified Duganella TaxID=2636909 RepID=UPI00088447DC|nr:MULTISPECIES: phytanoyl-CoA dioxygenase family protein [unclassified Duganella]SDH65196.1 Phytanoyl-CoA dioxygenase (PhyH) [Duganella sp. OV458]SDK74790.1 Phytanoyl-CoA dioxygenase (PhyH) [Duganella sp. OV510]